MPEQSVPHQRDEDDQPFGNETGKERTKNHENHRQDCAGRVRRRH